MDMSIQKMKDIIAKVFWFEIMQNEVTLKEDDDGFVVKFNGDVYAEGYTCEIQVRDTIEGWVCSINGFRAANINDSEAIAEYVLKQTKQFFRSPCPEQQLHEITLANTKSDESYY
jgi:hypothetical protein